MIELFNWLDEGGPLCQGLNVYRPLDKSSAGGYLIIGPALLYIRWSKLRHRLHFALEWRNWAEEARQAEEARAHWRSTRPQGLWYPHEDKPSGA